MMTMYCNIKNDEKENVLLLGYLINNINSCVSFYTNGFESRINNKNFDRKTWFDIEKRMQTILSKDDKS